MSGRGWRGFEDSTSKRPDRSVLIRASGLLQAILAFTKHCRVQKAAYVEHSRSEKGILDAARTRFLAADFVVAGAPVAPHIRTSYFLVAVGSAAAAAAAGLKLRLGYQTDHRVAEAAAAADSEIVHHSAVAGVAEWIRKARFVVEAA